MYPTVQVDDNAPNAPEWLGTKEKFWYEGPNRERWMFKRNRSGCGDDWAEKIACEICSELGIPHARYELARWRGQRGVVTRSIVPDRGRRVLGNELLPDLFPDYAGSRRFHNRQHTLGLVLTIISAGVSRPLGSAAFGGVETAADFFVGYVMLDALISNQDRHHENWALLISPESALHLAPTFDHASSLGTNETDENRLDRMTTKDRNRTMAAYVSRARSAFFRST